MQEITLLGRGMYLMEEPLFFGVAFEESPFMTYSITGRNQVSSPDVVTVVHPTEALLDSGNHRGSLTNKIPDGSFEVFGQNGGLGVPILVAGDQANYSEYNYLPGEDDYKRWTHWMQVGSGAVWVGANDRAYHGNYSAKTTLGAEAVSVVSARHPNVYYQTINETFGTPTLYYGRAVGQSITLASSGSLQSIKFLIAKQGSPTDSLFAQVSTSMGGTALGVSNFVNGASLETYPNPGWVTFTFTDVSLEAGVEYYVWVERSGPVGAPNVDYYFLQRTDGVTGDVYAGGAQFTYGVDDVWHKYDTYPSDYDMIFDGVLGTGTWSVDTKTGDASSRVLVPFRRDIHELVWPVADNQIFGWYSVDDTEHLNPHYNPPGWKNTVTAHVYAEQPCQLVMNIEIGGYNERLELGDSSPVPLPTVTHTVTHDVSPGSQQRFEIMYPTPYYEIFCAGNGDHMVTRLELQIINGVVGSSVWIDDVYHSGNLTTETNVMTTVGVAEWVTDERGKYIGAKLWFRVGDLIPPHCIAPEAPCWTSA
jgi:hypothetical protein